MKKEALLLVLLMLIIPTVLAAEINLNKESYQPGETLQAEIYGNFVDGLDVENIFFYRERNIPIDYDLLSVKDKRLLYALLPQKEGNYTLKIKNARYETDAGITTTELVKEFSIEKGNQTYLSIIPGFIVAREDFYIEVESSENIDTEIDFLGQKQSLSLLKDKEEKIYFSVEGIENYTEAEIKIMDYSIPVFIFPKQMQIILISEADKFRFNPQEIKATILEDEDYFFQTTLINLNRKNITDIGLSSDSEDLEISIVPNIIPKLEAGEKQFVNVTLNVRKKGTFSGEVLASSQNFSARLKFDIDVTENQSEIGYTGVSYTEDQSCSEIGQICSATQVCDGTSVFTSDGYCCRGKCTAEEESNAWIYGIIIIVVVVIALVIFSIFMRKKQRKKMNVLTEREKKYKERMSGRGGEVRGRLERT